MRYLYTGVLYFCIALILFSCERPSSPDFELQHQMEVPLIKEVSYIFLGDGSGAIVDTTSEDFENLFYETGTGLVVLSSEVDVDMGNFDSVSPGIEVEATEIEAEIGPISVDDFNAVFESEIGLISHRSEEFEEEAAEIGVFEAIFEGTGENSFSEVTGEPSMMPPGSTVPASPGVREVYSVLDLSTFEYALVEEGQLILQFDNDLGFDLSGMQVQLFSGYTSEYAPGTETGSVLVFEDVTHGGQVNGYIELEKGEVLEAPVALKLDMEWEDQSVVSASGLLSNSVSDDPLKVRSAIADIPGQALDPETELLEMDNPGFQYATVSDDPEDGVFELTIEVTNRTPLDVTNGSGDALPAIRVRNSDGDILGIQEYHTLEISGDPGATQLPAHSSGHVTIELYGAKITRSLEYDLDVGTPGGAALHIEQEDGFDVSVTTSDLQFTHAYSDIDPQEDIELEDEKKVEGDFVEAEVDEGSLIFTFQNEGNIDLLIENLELTNATGFVAKNTGAFFAAGSSVGTIQDVLVPAGQSTIVTLPIDGVGISDRMAFEGVASSPGSTEPVEVYSHDLLNSDMEGSVFLSSAEAAVKPQVFTSTGVVDISDDEIQLTREEHYIDLSDGRMVIGDFVNNIDLDIDTLVISFPGILVDHNNDGRYHEADSLWVVFSGDNYILRSRDSHTGQPVIHQSLEHTRMFAPRNEVVYNTRGVTRDTRTSAGADTLRSVDATDVFLAMVEIEDLEIKTAYGLIQKRTELLNDDPDEDGIVDLFNDNEAEVSEVEDLQSLSDKISGLQFTNPVFDLIYDTNLGARSVVVAAMVGINDDGEEVYLSPRPGSEYEVPEGEIPSGLYARGVPVPIEKLLRFEIEPVEEIGGMSRNGVVRFDIENSNVDDFLSNLPTEIRFVGNVITSPDGTEGFINKPVEFTSAMALDIPINLSTEDGSPASIRDTLSADLSDVPSPEDDFRVSEMTLFVTYENALPFKTGMELYFLDETGNVLLTGRGDQLEEVHFMMEGAQVNAETRFVSHPAADLLEISLTGPQLDYLYRTRNVMLVGELETSREEGDGEVKLRSRDYLKMKINSSIKTSIRVD
ncbi:hypothetical protein QLX67_02820 [Balneolaceae bacterium ANBcel3]|nr:hypothetical protein [Balneolaceae bacterium ANBcel3]